MSALPESCVVDASVGIKLFLEEDGSERVKQLFAWGFQQSDECLFVPDLFFIECANILWKKVQRAEFPFDSAADSIADLKSLELVATPTSDLITVAFDIACAHRVTAYDACYVALSEIKDVPLITADRKLREALAGSKCNVVML